MPAAVPIIAAGVTGLAQLGGSKLSSNASSRSAKLQSDAATRGAEIQAESVRKQVEAMTKQADYLRADSEIARKGNFGLGLVNNRNEASQFNTGNQLNAGVFNAGAANKRGEFNATRGDTNARYGALANDLSNIRAMLKGPSWTPATFAAIDPLERVTAGVYKPEEAVYLPGYVPSPPPNNA